MCFCFGSRYFLDPFAGVVGFQVDIVYIIDESIVYTIAFVDIIATLVLCELI